MLTKPIQIISSAIPVVGTVVLACVKGQSIPLYCYATMLIGVPVFVYLVTLLFNRLTNKSTEYLGAYVTRMTHYEAWDEKVLRIKQVEDGRDENGFTRYKTETYYENVYHPDTYTYETNTFKQGSISSETFEHWKEILGDNNPDFIDMFRNYDTIDGDAWRYKWNGELNSMIPLTFKHKYFNPLKHSDSLYKNRNISKEEAALNGLFEHPGLLGPFYQNCLLGYAKHYDWDNRIQQLNAKLGQLYQFRMFVIVFDGNKSDQKTTFNMQKAYWNRGNKNEFVLCLGINKKTGKILWHDSFSWCKEPKLESEVRKYLSDKRKFDCYDFCDWIEGVIPTAWKRREFSEFKYLTTKLPNWANAIIFTLSVISTIGIAFWGLN